MRISHALLAILAAATAAPLAAGAQTAQAVHAVPGFAGESLVFRARSSRVGSLGEARMWVERDASESRPLWVMHFDFHARVGFVSAEDRTTSWFDPARAATVRYVKHERHPLSRHDEDVVMDSTDHTWRDRDGNAGVSPTAQPLDELSFIYFLRGLTVGDSALVFNRHFDGDRNPVVVREIGREVLTVGAGTFRVVRVEMRVKDKRRYKGDGVILFDLSDDDCRLPVRIESTMPLVGRSVMTLDEYRHPRGACGARNPDTLASRTSGNP